MGPELEEHYPLRQAAEILGVHSITLRRWEVVLGPEGASPLALAAADVVVPSVEDALDLLLIPNRLKATLRG